MVSISALRPGGPAAAPGGPRGREAAQEGPGRLAGRHRGPDHRRHLLGQGLVRQPGIVQRLRQPPAARPHLRPQRLGRATCRSSRARSRRWSAARSFTRSTITIAPLPDSALASASRRAAPARSARSSSCCKGKLSKSVMDVVTAARRRPVPQAARDQDVVLLPGLGRHVQARRRRAVRRRRAARSASPSCSSCCARSIIWN